jgi:isochorismate hydrolase
MKREAYFTSETIREKSHAMLDALASLRARHTDIAFRRERSALLVLDMQEYFLRPTSHAFIPSAPALIPNLQSLIANYRSSNLPVIFTRHVNTDADAGMMSRWWRDVIRPDSPDSAISPSLDLSAGIIIDKPQYDAFYKTSLEENLQSRGVEQVLITGVMTHLCCESTARSAFVRGFAVFFCVDGTATYTEEVHRSSIKNLAHGFALPVLSEEISAKQA